MERVDQGHQPLGVAVAGGGGKVGEGLVAPGAVEGVLHHGQQLHVGEAQGVQVGDEPLRHLPVGQGAVPLLGHPLPGAQVDLVDRDGRGQAVPGRPVPHPVLVGPVEVGGPDDGGALGGTLAEEGEGVRLEEVPAVGGPDRVLVVGPDPRPGDKALPDARALPAGGQRMGPVVPAVEIRHHRDRRRVGGPDGEVDSLLVEGRRVGAQNVVEPEVLSLPEEIDVVVRQQARPVDHGADWQLAHPDSSFVSGGEKTAPGILRRLSHHARAEGSRDGSPLTPPSGIASPVPIVS